MKGQGSTEYLVIFAAVLVVALIVVFLLNQFGQYGQKSLIDNSKIYWASMMPVGVSDWAVTSSDGKNVTFTLTNKDVRKLTITNISLDDNAPSSALSVSLYPSDETETTVTFASAVCSSSDSGKMKEFDMVISYKKSFGTATYKEIGKVPMRVVCP